MVGAICLTWRNYDARIATTILAVALAMQFVDEAPLRQAVRAHMENSRPSPLVASAWEQLGRSVTKLIVLPAWQCGPSLTPGGPDGFGIFGSLAAVQGLATNNVYLARIGPNAVDTYCRTMPAKFRRGQVERDTAYVVSDDLARLIRVGRGSSLKCERVDGFNLCLPHHQLKLKSVELVKYRTAASDAGGLSPRRTSWRYPSGSAGLPVRAQSREETRARRSGHRGTI